MADILTNLVGHWKFDNDLTDASGNGYHGTPSSAVSYGAGRIGSAVTLVSPQSIAAPGPLLNITGPLTVAVWIHPASLTGYPTIIANWAFSAQQWKLVASLNGNGNPYFDVSSNGGNDIYRQSSAAIATGQWSHVAGVYTGTALNIYVNGALANGGLTGTVPAPSPARSPCRMRDPPNLRTF